MERGGRRGGLGSSVAAAVCLVEPGRPHASPHPRAGRWGLPALDRWVGGGEGHYHDGGGWGERSRV